MDVDGADRLAAPPAPAAVSSGRLSHEALAPRVAHGGVRPLPLDRNLTGAFVQATCFDYVSNLVSKAFIVEHNGKKRLVFNLKHLNDFCVKRQCRFGSLSALRRTLHELSLIHISEPTRPY